MLLDQPRDTAQWPTWVATAATAEHAAALLGLAGLVDRPVLFVPDRPGQIVLRTLAQLANAAADAVIDEVATADGVDQALVFGANHPQGPLAWARAFGLERAAIALENMAAETDELFYAPSPWFSKAARAVEVAA